MESLRHKLLFRSFYKFRTTLGHKANHMFEMNNADYDTILHPVHGPIACLVANRDINVGDEITVDYLYDVELADDWYQELYHKTYDITN